MAPFFRSLITSLLAGTVFFILMPRSSLAFAPKRPVTVRDAIEMTRIAGTPYAAVRPSDGFAVPSPDQKHFAIVLSRGNTKANTNEYSLLVFAAADLFARALPQILVVFSSSSNLAGISDLKWSEDSGWIFFLGAQGREPTQLYSINCSSKKLMKLTHHPTALLSYAIAEKSRKIVFAARTPDINIISIENVRRQGLAVSDEHLPDLLLGRISHIGSELFETARDGRMERPIRTRVSPDGGASDLYLSPTGRYLVCKTITADVPRVWGQYEEPNIQRIFHLQSRKAARLLHYELIDIRTGISHILLNSPAGGGSSDVLWSPDSRSLILSGTFLPLDTSDPSEVKSRQSTRYVVEVNLTDRSFLKITADDLTAFRWDEQMNVVSFYAARSDGAHKIVRYRKIGKRWQSMAEWAIQAEVQPEIVADQDMNRWPRLIAKNTSTGQSQTILDLNPKFADLAFGRVEEIHWEDGSGNLVTGGLYLPADYCRGKKYPLVIQTHGFNAREFWIDGSHMTATAAQPLSGREIVVLQINDILPESLDTPNEAERAMTVYENAVKYLVAEGIIDPDRVGIVGFSRTCFYVEYSLTHSAQHFAAAILADGFDAGYFQYLVSANVPGLTDEIDSVIGDSPFGSGLYKWLKQSPGFKLDQVSTPVQLQAIGSASLLGEWQWFAGLKRLDKPVDLVYLPTGEHVLVRPWDRMVSQQSSVDWFCFWLKGEEDTDSSKAGQYNRWRALRAQSLHSRSVDKTQVRENIDMRMTPPVSTEYSLSVSTSERQWWTGTDRSLSGGTMLQRKPEHLYDTVLR